MARATFQPGNPPLGGQTLKAAGLVTTTANATAVDLGRGRFLLEINTTAIDADATDDLYLVKVQANTEAATSTWVDITPKMAWGNTTATGDTDGTDAVGKDYIEVWNPNDHQVRVRTIVVGTVTTGINQTITAYRPIGR